MFKYVTFILSRVSSVNTSMEFLYLFLYLFSRLLRVSLYFLLYFWPLSLLKTFGFAKISNYFYSLDLEVTSSLLFLCLLVIVFTCSSVGFYKISMIFFYTKLKYGYLYLLHLFKKFYEFNDFK